MNKFIALLSLFIFTESFSQNEILELPVNYESTLFHNTKESLAISNEETGELIVFVEDNNKSRAYLLDKNFKIESEVFMQSLPNTFKNFIGHQINENGSYSIFFTNNNEKKYGAININFSSKKVVVNELDFKLKREAYVESVSFAGNFYLMSVTKNSSDVNFYSYSNKSFSKIKSISFDFVESIDGYSKAYHLLVSKGIGATGDLVKMDTNTPNVIEITSKPSKLYTIDNQFVFTFDVFNDKTKVIIVDPNTFESEFLEFDKPKFESTFNVNHNSYLYDDKIFQIKSSTNRMNFTVKDFKTKKLLKEIVLNKEDSITFKNTPIIQEGSGFVGGTKIREMEKTSKLLRKISSGNIGISAYKQNEDYKVTLGSKVVVRSGGAGFGPMGGFGGVPIGGGIGPISTSFNPTFFAYGGYSSSKSTHIDCLFNNNFEHIEGDISENVFDKVKAFEDTFEENHSGKIELKNLFRHKGKLYFGYLNANDKNYHLVEFLD